MLSASELLSPNSTIVEITFLPTRNVYHYNPSPLLLSYGLALLFAILGVALGLYAFHLNGVIHSTAFSSIVATTRNRELDELARGKSLGALPRDERFGGVRLRFGGLGGGDGGNGGEGVEHVGFGREEGVVGVRRGGRYV
ncbi:uncharacterized protein LY89DRAFT_761537 [Mollisia scopiformis]|uniref:Uncharacterized protein n=1 Tax=Mollisia scopiformis TaxID=149040 RepID=A0A132BC00_MOLSC|nr:uncharacterized protein LY89DRAFT_761537 [Mollisia scopiformis]KUJ09793.1 hypothetical protein LY89DRAFT_761537 [Mollisia scopiformis]